MKKVIGYTQGTFDLFHIGHLNLLKNAKEKCDFLIVGINADNLVMNYKNRKPVINEIDRASIVSEIKVVDNVLIVNTLDKIELYKSIKFNKIFIGDDWKGNNRWIRTEKDLAEFEVEVIYIPYTKRISTTKIITKLEKKDKLYDKRIAD